MFNITVIDLSGRWRTFAKRMRVNRLPRSILSMKYSAFHRPLTVSLEIAPYTPATGDLKEVMNLDSTHAREVSLVVNDVAAAMYLRLRRLLGSSCRCERGRRCA